MMNAIVSQGPGEPGHPIYEHRLLNGLPASLIRPEGKTFPVIALMQRQAGLNRDRRRELAGGGKIPASDGRHLGQVPRADLNVVSYYMIGANRAYAFWHVLRDLSDEKKPQGSRAYALALDVQLLQEYEPDWVRLEYDEAALAESCPQWPEIQRHLFSTGPAFVKKLPLGVFMLWPRLLQDLARWHDLGEGRQLTVGRAIFSLSSISLSDWWMRHAVRVCPELKEELGELIADRPDEVPKEKPEELPGWEALVQRLDAIAQEIHEHPTRDAISELLRVAQEFQAHASALPLREDSAAKEFDSKLESLLAHCRSLATDPAFGWFDGPLVDQVDARWRLARDAAGADQLPALCSDAEDAFARSDAAADAYRGAVVTEVQQGAELEQAKKQLAHTKSIVDRRVSERRIKDLTKSHLEAGDGLTRLQDEFLTAISPWQEVFDVSVDYSALVRRPPEAAFTEDDDVPEAAAPGEVSALAATPPAQDAAERESASGPHSEAPPVHLAATPVQPPPLPAQLQADPQHAADAPLLGAESVSSTAAAPAFSPVAAPAAGPAVSPAPDSPRASAAPDGVAPANNSSPYTEEAGEICRPIWTLVRSDRVSLAYHVARWTQEIHRDIVLPPTALLRSVALASQLVVPDGEIQEAISAAYEEISSEQFTPAGPHAWHSALNLLLVAATLRPMVIAPSTGAPSVAGYLHLDARFSSLYELVREIRERSQLLMNFRIDPGILRQARGEAAIREEMSALQHAAQDWFKVQAPAITIKFAAATHVWRHWLRPQGIISQVVSPVIHNRQTELSHVRELVGTLAEKTNVHRLIRETDRKELRRRRGEDIHAGALEHLERCVNGALALARNWVSLVELQGQSGDRMREILADLRARLGLHEDAVRKELTSADADDEWGLIGAGRAAALAALERVMALFDPDADLPRREPAANEALASDLLLIPGIRLSDDWLPLTAAPPALAAAIDWMKEPLTGTAAFEARLASGDLHAATILAENGNAGSPEQCALRVKQEREHWRNDLRREIGETRREVEIGSAYGYLPDADRGELESALARWEGQLDDVKRFDLAVSSMREARARVARSREVKVEQIRQLLKNLAVAESDLGVVEVNAALADGDIATAYELVHRISQGLPPWPEDKASEIDHFVRFFPKGTQVIEAWLEGTRREVVEQALRQGQTPEGLDAERAAGAQRDQAVRMFNAWSDMKPRKQAEAGRLETLMTGLGLTVRGVQRLEQLPGREIWSLEASPLEDRHVCPIPLFGSMARGKYRIVCVWERPTEDDLLQWVGDTAVQRPTLLLYFGRMTERKWRDLSKLAKVKRRSFLILDETLLVFLCNVAGSRQRSWFECALPFTYSSPYDATAGLVPPEMFYGRGTELDAVRGLNGRCFIYGGRQLGKTALLKRAEQAFHSPGAGRFARWIDLRAEGIGLSRAAGELWISLAEQLKEMGVLDAKAQVPSLAKKQSVEILIKAVRDFLGADLDRRILLLLDEADRFFELDGRSDFAETRRLKQLMDETGRRFKVVFAGLHNVLRMTERANHPLAHFGEPIEIGPLREGEEVREAEELVRRPMAAAGFEFDSRASIIRILAQTNYYPSLIQLYCSHLLRHMLARVTAVQRLNGPRYAITDRDIEQVYSSGALRDEIRAKFRLTLQLDPRYEVIAYAIALDLLRNRFSHSEGLGWQAIRQSGALYWWPDGFRDTGELDFRVLLDEMVGLGVLSRLQSGRYTLRNPNVLLLLGTQEEIESVLIKEREPAVEFESASFRPPLRSAPAGPKRNVFTFQQLSELLRRSNGVSVVTGTACAGIAYVQGSLEDYLGPGSKPVVLDGCSNRTGFVASLDKALERRGSDAVSSLVVPATIPWSGVWLDDAAQKLARLSSGSRFASLIFVADPSTLWSILSDPVAGAQRAIPWMSLLHWRDEYLRHWLEERQIQLEAEDRRKLGKVTGYWPELIMEVAADCAEARDLRLRVAALERPDSWSPTRIQRWAPEFGLNVHEPARILAVLAKLGEPVDSGELALVAECDACTADLALRWGELLGLARREGASFWTVDEVAAQMLRNMAV